MVFERERKCHLTAIPLPEGRYRLLLLKKLFHGDSIKCVKLEIKQEKETSKVLEKKKVREGKDWKIIKR